MGCGDFCVKYVLFFANLFFALSGLALLGIGIAVELKFSGITEILAEHNVSIAPILSMVVGSIVFFGCCGAIRESNCMLVTLSGLALLGIGIAVELKVSGITEILAEYNVSIAPILSIVVGSIVFFGCCGAIRESNCMLVTYAIFMIILMVLKITLATLIFVILGSLLEEIQRILNESFNNNPTNFSNTVGSMFQCCGTTGPLAYLTRPLPDTCCAAPPCSILNSYGGCNDAFNTFATTLAHAIAFFAITVAAVELVTVVFALCLANSIRNKARRTRY